MNHKKWTEIIEARHSLLDLKLKEVWNYKDLVYMFIKEISYLVLNRQFQVPSGFYKPYLYDNYFSHCFGKIARLPTDGAPPLLFYLSGSPSGIIFSSCLLGTSSTFVGNAGIFGKVYFPRLVTPVSIVISNLMRFGVQFLLFLMVWIYYLFKGAIHPNIWMLATPFLIILMAFLHQAQE